MKTSTWQFKIVFTIILPSWRLITKLRMTNVRRRFSVRTRFHLRTDSPPLCFQVSGGASERVGAKQQLKLQKWRAWSVISRCLTQRNSAYEYTHTHTRQVDTAKLSERVIITLRQIAVTNVNMNAKKDVIICHYEKQKQNTIRKVSAFWLLNWIIYCLSFKQMKVESVHM